MIRATLIELTRPLDISWDELGALLRDRRAVSHRLLNAAILHIITEKRRGEKNPRGLVGIKEELEKYKTWAAEKALKAKTEKDRDHLLRLSKLNISSSITDAMQVRANDQVLKWFKGNRNDRIPSFKQNSPIFIRDGGWSLSQEDGAFVLSVGLEGKSPETPRPGRIRIVVAGSTGTHWARLKEIASGKVKVGDCKIIYLEDKKKWGAILSYHVDAKPLEMDPERVLVVHRGMRNAFYCIGSDGWKGFAIRGRKFLHTKRALAERLRDSRTISHGERGSGSKGHGKKRRFRSIDHIDSKIKKVVKTTCQQWSATIKKIAKDHGYGKIVIEDFGGIQPDADRGKRRFLERFPFHALKQTLISAIEPLSLELDEVSCEYISSTCPRCGNVDTTQHNTRTNTFHCKICHFGPREADFVAALMMLRLAGHSGHWDEYLKEELRRAKRIKKGEAA